MNYKSVFVEVRMDIFGAPTGKKPGPSPSQRTRPDTSPEEQKRIYRFLMEHYSHEIAHTVSELEKNLLRSVVYQRKGRISSGPVRLPQRLARAVQAAAYKDVLEKEILSPLMRHKMRRTPRQHGVFVR